MSGELVSAWGTRRRVIAPAAAAAMLLLAACGGSDSKDNTSQPSSTGSNTGSTPSSSAMPGMDMSASPSATPAAALDSGTYEGTFSNVADAPDGTKAIAGTATMVQTKTGTTVSIAATGLDPKVVYVAHVHKASCSEMEGGTHFQFEPGGDPKPPNEVWLTPVTVTSTGHGTAKTKTDKPVNSDAKSVVIHQKRAAGATTDEAKPPKLACADLAPKK